MFSVSLTVPATTANLGPGFDCIGAALSLYNKFKVTKKNGATTIVVQGQEAAKVKTDQNNLFYQAFSRLYHQIKQPVPDVEIAIDLGVPLARGLGSSATAIVGGLMGANALAGSPLTPTEVMELAIDLEGHPDNVVPALLGNCQLSVGEKGNWQISEIPWHREIIPVIAIPDFELSTEEARAVLPKQVTRADAIFNIAHLGILIRALETGRGEWLKVSLEDKIHQPYRQELIKGYQGVKMAAINAGAYGVVISGAGPTLLALTAIEYTGSVIVAMQKAWQKEGITAVVRSLSLDTEGTKIESIS